ncbi:PKD domain-containing protein [Massilia rhizosphaerae]|uniref:PKD domain-containing protein n=1 Tax=Massilia rhizosphaerae TaxID=2784389 RepID=UPI0018DB74D9|nr:PKD domain-containing protein [Massilia rhizosphaerae]
MKHDVLQGFNPRRALLLSPLVLFGLASAQMASTAPAPASPAATMAPAASYSVVNLGEGAVGRAAINRYGQVAYGIDRSGFFYDGSRIIPIPGIAGASLVAPINLNDKGQVVGAAAVGDNNGNIHAFVWSKQTGTRDLLPLDHASTAEARDINNYGVAAGDSLQDPAGRLPGHAVLWKAPGRRYDLGALGKGLSFAEAINDAGLVAGDSYLHGTILHAFAWTRATGMIDIGTLPGGTVSEARAVDEFGEIAGNADVAPLETHVFLWTRTAGIRDLGAAGADTATMLGMSTRGRIAGELLTRGGEHAMTWTHATGMLDIGTLPGGGSARAWAANNYGQVVGDSQLNGQAQYRAFIWTAQTGMIDLNTRVRNLPQGMVLQQASAISDDGSIVVRTIGGLVLLKPGRCGCGAAVGPIQAPGVVTAGSPYLVSASLSDEDTSTVHTVSWSWGDGSSEPARNAIERKGDGNASASHVFSKPGTYRVTLQVSDKSGHRATVTRKVVVQGMTAPGQQG